MKLSEQIPHEEGCNATYKPWEKPNECDCYVSKIAQLEAHFNAELSAAKNDYARIVAMKTENAALKREQVRIRQHLRTFTSGLITIEQMYIVADALLTAEEEDGE